MWGRKRTVLPIVAQGDEMPQNQQHQLQRRNLITCRVGEIAAIIVRFSLAVPPFLVVCRINPQMHQPVLSQKETDPADLFAGHFRLREGFAQKKCAEQYGAMKVKSSALAIGFSLSSSHDHSS